MSPSSRSAGGGPVLALRRRSGVERRVLQMLRSGEARIFTSGRSRREPPADRAGALDVAPFDELRRLAMAAGLAIFPVEAPYITDGELAVLSWIAHAQRPTGQVDVLPADRGLSAAIVQCAAALALAGQRLPLSIYLVRGGIVVA